MYNGRLAEKRESAGRSLAGAAVRSGHSDPWRPAMSGSGDAREAALSFPWGRQHGASDARRAGAGPRGQSPARLYTAAAKAERAQARAMIAAVSELSRQISALLD